MVGVIVHMGGRIYDPTLGRFMQADPIIQAPLNSQNYNRYSYVLNNPMSYTDPSGYSFWSSIKKYWRTIVAIVVTVYLGPVAQFIFGNVAGAAVAGFVAGGIATGSLRGALVGAFTGAMFGQLHSMAAGAGKVVAHGFAGGISSLLNGGKFGHGFAAAGFTQAMGNVKGLFTNAPRGMARLGNALKAALIGGTASRLTGGKFANGAVTGAFSRLLNDDATGRYDKEPTWDDLSDEEQRNLASRILAEANERINEIDKALIGKAGGFSNEIRDRYGISLNALSVDVEITLRSYRQDLQLINFKSTYNMLSSGASNVSYRVAKGVGNYALSKNPVKKLWAVVEAVFLSDYSPTGKHFYLCGYGKCDVVTKYSW